MSAFILQAEKVSKSFAYPDGASFSVLDNLSLDVPAGAIVSILGASGCGKTTLLKLLAGLEKADSGQVSSQIARPGKKIGFMQQGERLLPWRNILENVALGLELTGAVAQVARHKAQEMLHTVGLADFASSFPHEISGGMTQRVLLARTLAQEPSLLLLDEPLGQLDVIGRKELAAIIRQYVNGTKAAALLVTHSVEEAIFIADYVLTLSRRPARIVDRFALNGGRTNGGQGFTHLDRQECFERVRCSLLSALERINDGGAP